MARQMRLFLIRHGETVDNVAQLYAGSRDSALTNHGHQQAKRLGQHFASSGVIFTHLFSSHLQRAAKTAGLIRDAQTLRAADGSSRNVPDVVQLPLLMEQDFGFYEGKKWHERPVGRKQSGKEHQNTEGFVDVESKESLAQRADAFLDGHLLPLLDSPAEFAEPVVAIVSHGVMLSSLWKRILARLPEKSVKLALELAATAPVMLEHLGAWSNTGFLELYMSRTLPEATKPAVVEQAGLDTKTELSSLLDATPVSNDDAAPSEGSAVVPMQSSRSTTTSGPRKLGPEWSTVIRTINGKDHMKTLKRTGGGVGSSRHDVSQKNIDSFFKRRRVD